MEIPKVKLVTQPETHEAKDIVGYNGMKLLGQDIFWEDDQTDLTKVNFRFVKIVKRQ